MFLLTFFAAFATTDLRVPVILITYFFVSLFIAGSLFLSFIVAKAYLLPEVQPESRSVIVELEEENPSVGAPSKAHQHDTLPQDSKAEDFLIPPSPIAKVGHAGWTNVKRSDCYVWNDDPQEGESADWSGDCLNQFASGPGRLDWSLLSGESQFAIGSMDAGRLQGEVSYTYSSGGSYNGEYVAGKRAGYGVYIYPNGNRYDGNWTNGVKSGAGNLYFANGNHFSGFWVNDLPNGKGTLTFSNGQYITRWWTDGCSEGTRVLAEKCPEPTKQEPTLEEPTIEIDPPGTVVIFQPLTNGRSRGRGVDSVCSQLAREKRDC
jgi:hypothetical protein